MSDPTDPAQPADRLPPLPADQLTDAQRDAMAEIVAGPRGELVGPFVIDGAGHFLQWERASVLNQAVRYFCLDLLGESEDG